MTSTEVRQRTLFLSSSQRESNSGSLADFCVDISPLIYNLATSSDSLVLSVNHVFIPFRPGSRGFVDRIPESSSNDQVQLVRLHSDLLHQNLNHNSYTSVLLQFPFAHTYKEAFEQKSDDEQLFSSVYYKDQAEDTSRFSLYKGGTHQISCVRFWLTDERNRLIIPAADWNVALNIAFVPDHINNHLNTQKLIIRHLEELIEIDRLRLFQAASKQEDALFSARGLPPQ